MRYPRYVILLAMATLLSFLIAEGPVTSAQNQGGAQYQQPGPPGTFRVRVRLIPVNVIVTDQHDNPVTDLRQEDFQIYENGRLQGIAHFSLETLAATAPESGQTSVQRMAAPRELTSQPARTFLILMGRGHHQTPLKAVDALIRFVRNDLLPKDRVAVFAYNRATDFTTDHERIAQVLERYKKSNDKIESWLETRLRGLTVIYGIKDVPKSLQPEIDKIFEKSGGLTARQVPPGRMTEKGKVVKDWDLAAELLLKNSDQAAEAEMRKAVADELAETGEPSSKLMQALIAFDAIGGSFITMALPFDEFAPKAAGSFQDLQNLFTCIEYLRYMDGQKHLLFFSGEGLLFPSGNVDFDKGVVAIANDARVTINTFETGGVFYDREFVATKGTTLSAPPRGTQTVPEPPPPTLSQSGWSRAFMLSFLGNVSQLTGGRASIGEGIGKTLDRLDKTTRVHYLLGYYPKDDSWDGQYRHINVKVNRPGTKVSFRHGYYARDSLRPYDREEFLAYSRISATAGYESDVVDIPFRIATARDPGSQPQIKVDLQIDAEKVRFKMVDDRHSGRLYITVFYADANGSYLGETWKTMNLELPEKSYQDIMRSAIQFSTLIPLKAPNQILKVVVYDTVGDRVGSKLIKIR